MFLITGITGKVGGAAARHLLNKGKQVRALVRDPAKAAAWSANGVELVEGEWADPIAMTRALEGVEGRVPHDAADPDAFARLPRGQGHHCQLHASSGQVCAA